MRKNDLFFYFILLLFGCNEPVARKPIYRSDNSEIRASIDRNIKINKVQQEQFKKVVSQDSTLNFTATSAGYWVAIERKLSKGEPQNLATKFNSITKSKLLKEWLFMMKWNWVL